MIFKLAWRNIWRNPARSFVVIGAIIIGVWSVIFLMGVMQGLINSYVENAIKRETSHIQIHHPDYMKDKESKFYMDHADQILETIGQIPGVRATTIRSQSNVMIGSSHGTRGIRINGIIPGREEKLTGLADLIVEGSYLEEGKKNQILLSARLAGKLKVKLRSKLILTFQTLEGEIISGAFRIKGIFDTKNAMFDDNIAFVDISSMNELLGKENIGHEAMIYVENVEKMDSSVVLLKKAFPDLLVQNYREISPELGLFETQIGMAGRIYMVIFMLALIFGIINTMLMAVLERVRELGMLMAVGMNKLKIFSMIVLETILLGVVGAPIGIGLGYLITSYYSTRGINLVIFSKEGMEQFGMTNFIFPSVTPEDYIFLAMSVFITALLASLYPAYKAIKLNPVESIRKM